jgi:hypothetical protein
MTDYQTIAKSKALYLDACVLPKIDIETGGEVARILTYASRIPIFTSFVGFGEFFKVAGWRSTQKQIGADGYLYSCRKLMMDQQIGKIRRAEPIEDRFAFIRLAHRLRKSWKLGGGDVWHLMSAIELQSQHSPLTFFSFEKKLVAAAKSEGIEAVYGIGLEPDRVREELKKKGKLIGN